MLNDTQRCLICNIFATSYICIHTKICIYIYIETFDAEGEKERDQERERESNREKEGESERESKTERTRERTQKHMKIV